MQAWHQKTILDAETRLNIFISEDEEFPPHWHEAVEVVYVLDGNLSVGINGETFRLKPRDILLISGGDVHYFLLQPLKVRRVILQFEMIYIEPFASAVKNRRFSRQIIRERDTSNADGKAGVHAVLEKYILEILGEYMDRKEGYPLAIKARLFDILVTLLRHLPLESYSSNERNKNLNRLERLEHVFRYVENSYDRIITLEQAAGEANYSVYHFTRFFKNATGMTFWQYLNNIRVAKSIELLTGSDIPITEIAFRSGFGSIKTFNRVFKEVKGCSPKEYRRAIFG